MTLVTKGYSYSIGIYNIYIGALWHGFYGAMAWHGLYGMYGGMTVAVVGRFAHLKTMEANAINGAGEWTSAWPLWVDLLSLVALPGT